MKIGIPPTKSIFRLQNKNNKSKQFSADAVIIVKLMSPYDKNYFLKTLNEFRKINKCNLTLDMLGFDTNRPFYINENLTHSNYLILQDAIRLKRNNVIQSAYTFRGLVYVKRTTNDQPICIDRIEVLQQFYGERMPNNEGPMVEAC